MATRSSFDKSGQAFQRGASAETKFEMVLKTRFPGRKVIRANKHEETIEHWDYRLCFDQFCTKSNKYEVKGMRKLEMRDDKPQDNFYPVEFLSVDGHNGWIFGKADYIAFETSSDWLIVKPDDLLRKAVIKIKETNPKVQIDSLDKLLTAPELRVDRSNLAHGKIYGRQGRGDAITWVAKEDILSLPHEIWKEGERAIIPVEAEPIKISVLLKRGNKGPGGKQLYNSDVTVSQGRKASTVMLQGKWDQAKVEDKLNLMMSKDKWNFDAVVLLLQQLAKQSSSFKEWLMNMESIFLLH